MKEDRILSHNIGEAESLFLYLDSGGGRYFTLSNLAIPVALVSFFECLTKMA